MKNLACRRPTPEKIQEINDCVCSELKKAGIPAILNDPKERGEVPSEFDGKYKGFYFRRAWYYWMVTGAVPLEVAKELYANPNGVEDVRVTGHCGCPPPEDWAVEIEVNTGRKLVSDKQYEDILQLFEDHQDMLLRWKTEHVRENEAGEKRSFILSYHIDTQEGLNLFMDTIRKHNLNGSAYH